jgi:outer membrane protein TolC
MLLLPLLAGGLAAIQDAPGEVPQVPALELSIEDALRVAIERNLELELEDLNTDIANYDYLGSWGAFDPVVGATAGLTDSESQGSSGLSGGTVVETDSQNLSGSLFVPFTTGGSLDLTYARDNTRTNNSFALFDTSTTDVVTVALTQPLLRNGWRRFATSEQREAEIALRQQEARRDEVRHRVLRDVANAYWDVVGAVEDLGVQEVALETAQTQLDQNRRRLEVGVGTEVLQAETNVAALEEERLLAESTLRAAEDALRTLLFQGSDGNLVQEAMEWDLPISALTPLPDVDATELPTWTTSLALALESRPELVQQRLAVEAANVLLDRAESLRLPALDFSLEAASTGFDEDPNEAMSTALGYDFPTYTGSLRFSMPIRNRTARYGERSARAQVIASRIVYSQVELTVLADVRTAVRELAYAGESVAAAEKSAQFAERQLAAEEARFEEGLSTTFQVLEFQRDLAEARSTLTAARARYAKALVGLRYAEGVIRTPEDAPGGRESE